MSDDKQQAQRDAVTIGQIRKRFNDMLESQIDVLSKLIRQGCYQQADKYLEEAIAKTLTDLQNINAMASTEILFPMEPDNDKR